MSNIRGIDGGSLRGAAPVTYVDFRAATSTGTLSSTAAASNVAYGAALTNPDQKRIDGVDSIAARFPDFDSALVPMVLASGVDARAAFEVANAIRSNPNLLAQAQRAYEQARGR